MAKLTDEQYERLEHNEEAQDIIRRVSDAADNVRLCRRKGADGTYCSEGWVTAPLCRDGVEWTAVQRCECYREYARAMKVAYGAKVELPHHVYNLASPIGARQELTEDQRQWQHRKLQELREQMTGFGDFERGEGW